MKINLAEQFASGEDLRLDSLRAEGYINFLNVGATHESPFLNDLCIIAEAEIFEVGASHKRVLSHAEKERGHLKRFELDASPKRIIINIIDSIGYLAVLEIHASVKAMCRDTDETVRQGYFLQTGAAREAAFADFLEGDR